MSDVTTVEGITVVGQRRVASGLGFPIRPGGGGGGGGTSGGEEENTLPDDPNWGQPELLVQDPCANPASALAWNADAAAAKTTRDIEAFAASNFPSEQGINDREYGAALWEMPDGSIIAGPITASEFTFFEAAQILREDQNARVSVELDWTPPGPGAVHWGTIHTHNMDAFLPSGNSYSDGDQGVLTYSQNLREAQKPGAGSQASLYVVARKPGSYEALGPTKIVHYDQRNRDDAISGQEGSEVNPEAQTCP